MYARTTTLSLSRSKLNDERAVQELVLLPPRVSLSTALSLSLPKTSVIPSHLSPITALKAIKNSVELEGFRESHRRDGVALVRYFNWLEKRLESGMEIKEFDAATQLEKFRSYAVPLAPLLLLRLSP